MNPDGIDTEEIRKEIQGDGLLNEVRERHLPGSNQMSEQTLKMWEDEEYKITPDSVKNNADTLLQELISREQKLYNHHQSKVYREALVYFLEEKYGEGQAALSSFGSSSEEDMDYTEYPNLQELFTEIEENYNDIDGFIPLFEKILPKLYPAMDAISVSAQQSRRKRAGSSLQNHLMNLLDRSDIRIDNVKTAGNGQVYYLAKENEPNDVEAIPVYISCLTTMRDRFRQSLSDPPAMLSGEDRRRFIATASGTNLITASASEDVTAKKVQEVIEEGFTLIVFETVKKSQFVDVEGVISYKEFFSTVLPDIL